MARISVVDDSITLDRPVFVEGFPGVGLVGKIAADHLVDVHDMRHYANVHCEGLPDVAVYRESDRRITTPVRLYAAPEPGLVVLQSDVPVTPSAAAGFTDCLASWFDDTGAFPVFLSGRPTERDATPPALYGVATGDADERLRDAAVDEPPESGLVSGPTGSMLADALERDRDAIGLIVESDPQFPDPEASRTLIVNGIDPVAGTETSTDGLVDQATEIRDAKQQLAERMRQASEESTQAEPLKMYQ
ncbi:MAG: PAC2 family protein [Halorubrum sp.]